MIGKGRTGPRERQTMSGILSDRREPSAGESLPARARENTPPPIETETVIIEQQALVQMSLWKRVLEAAEREFERDDSTPGGLNWAGRQDRGERVGRDRDEDET